jgi:phenylacetate-CoA ligase
MTAAVIAAQFEDWELMRGRDLRLAAQAAEKAAAALPFYQEKFAGSDFSPAAFGELPLTAKNEVRLEQEQHPPFGRMSPAAREDVIQLHMSSGTTGRPLYVPVTRADLEGWRMSYGRMLTAAGLEPGDLCVHALAMSRAFGGGMPMVQLAQSNGVGMVPMGAESGAERILRAVRDLRPTAMMATPHFLLYLGERAQDVLGAPIRSFLSLKAMIAGGEPGAPALRGRLEELWGGRLCDLFGSSEALPGSWHSCEADESLHFCGQGITYFELLDEQGRSLPIEPGARGELIYSDLPHRTGLRVVRYRCGDMVEVVGMDCACGRTGPKVKVVGRVDDTLIIRGVNVSPVSVQQAVAPFAPHVSGRVQIQWREDGYTSQQPLDLHVERGPDPIEDEDELIGRLELAVHTRCNCRANITLVPPAALRPEDDRKVVLVKMIGSR